jgi:hypothetical protein
MQRGRKFGSGQAAGRAVSRPKEKWAFAHSSLRVTPQCAEGEAKGQIRLLLKSTPFSREFQRFPAGRPKAAFPSIKSISPVGYRINSSAEAMACIKERLHDCSIFRIAGAEEMLQILY